MLSQGATQWAYGTRKISPETLATLPVASGTTYFPDLSAKSEALFFKYNEGWKARAFPDKAFVAGGGFKPSFWNLRAVLENQTPTVFITEGEMDVAALVESGIPQTQVLSVPTGASGSPLNGGSNGHSSPSPPQWATDALQAGLNKARRIVWCGDTDEPGLALRAKMMAAFGIARFMVVDWPPGVTDPNGMLMAYGQNALREITLSGAKLIPQYGLYRLSELPTPPPLDIWIPSMGGFEGRVHIAPRTLSVVTGQPNHGKTQLWAQLWFDIARRYELVMCVASFETRPKPHLRRQIRTLLTGRLEIEMSDAETRQTDKWIEDHYLFLMHHEQRPTLDWLLDCAETAVIRHGARVIQIDPWNRLEGTRQRDETESEYILRCLRALYVFANDMDCHVQVVAHPSKMDSHRRGEPPALEDISGSKHWENMVDQGFTVHRPQMFEGAERKTQTAFYHRKSRFAELGYCCKIMLNYNLDRHRYEPLNPEDH